MKHSPYLLALLVALPLGVPFGFLAYLFTGDGMAGLFSVLCWETTCLLFMPLVLALDDAHDDAKSSFQ